MILVLFESFFKPFCVCTNINHGNGRKLLQASDKFQKRLRVSFRPQQKSYPRFDRKIPCAATHPMSKREAASPSDRAFCSACPSGGFQSLSKASTPPRIGIGGLASRSPGLTFIFSSYSFLLAATSF
jgi:hypothetical protein